MKVKHPHFSPKTQSSDRLRKRQNANTSAQKTSPEVDLTRDAMKRAKLLSDDPAKLGGALREPSSNVETRSQIDSNKGLLSLSGFNQNNIDPCTGRTFIDLMRERFDDERPYCFASAIPSGTASKKAIFLDGRSVISGIGKIPLARPFRIIVKKTVMSFSELHFFCARKSKIESLGSLNDIQTHPYFYHLQQMITQKEVDVHSSEYPEERAGMYVNIALLYGAGIGVQCDSEYAELLRRRIDPKFLTTALARNFTHVATIKSDTCLAEHLLAVQADPKVPDPDDDYSAVAMARKHDNRLLIDLFRSRNII